MSDARKYLETKVVEARATIALCEELLDNLDAWGLEGLDLPSGANLDRAFAVAHEFATAGERRKKVLEVMESMYGDQWVGPAMVARTLYGSRVTVAQRRNVGRDIRDLTKEGKLMTKGPGLYRPLSRAERLTRAIIPDSPDQGDGAG